MGSATHYWNTRKKRDSKTESKQYAAKQDPRFKRAVTMGLIDPNKPIGIATIGKGPNANKYFIPKQAERVLSSKATEADTRELQTRQREEIKGQAQEEAQIRGRAKRRRSNPRSLIAQSQGSTLGSMGNLGAGQ